MLNLRRSAAPTSPAGVVSEAQRVLAAGDGLDVAAGRARTARGVVGRRPAPRGCRDLA